MRSLFLIIGLNGGLIDRVVFVGLIGEENVNGDVRISRIGVLMIRIGDAIGSSY